MEEIQQTEETKSGISLVEGDGIRTISTTTKPLGKVGLVARFKPVHKGHEAMLQSVCEKAEHAIIGIGSPNVYDVRNPFTYEETEAMVRIALFGYSNYSIIPVHTFNNGPVWREHILELYKGIDCFVTANSYVRSLLEKDYKIIHPVTLIPVDKHIPLNATMVRNAMARGERWEELVPHLVTKYIKENKLDSRFCSEFGLATLVESMYNKSGEQP